MACTKLCVLKCKVIHCVYYPGRNKRATMTKDHFLLLSCDATSVFIRQECFSSHIHNSTTYFVLYRHYITTTTIPFSQKQATPSWMATACSNTITSHALKILSKESRKNGFNFWTFVHLSNVIFVFYFRRKTFSSFFLFCFFFIFCGCWSSLLLAQVRWEVDCLFVAKLGP